MTHSSFTYGHAYCIFDRWRHRSLVIETVGTSLLKATGVQVSNYKGSRHHVGNSTEAGNNLAAETTTLLS